MVYHNSINYSKNSKKIKIVLIIGDIARSGGTERSTINLANMLISKHEVVVVSLSENRPVFFELDQRVTLDFLSMKPMTIKLTSKIIWYIEFFSKMKKTIARHKPDVIIGEGHNISGVLPFVKGTEKIKKIACEHIDYDSIPLLSRVLMKIGYSKLTAVVTLSTIALNKIKHLNKNIKIIPNSLPFFTEAVSNVTENTIIMVGRLSQEKGYDRVVPIAKKLLNEFPHWRIKIFGNGDKEMELKKLFKNEGLDNVLFFSPVKNIVDQYMAASIFMITSYNEALPMVILEAQHCGLPVVGYFCEGTQALIKENITGYVLDNEDDFYEKLKKLISNQDLRLKIGGNCKMESLKYSPDMILKKWESLLS
ncbi:glycosyltransferase [Flavobacterium oreochromis]|uniref:Glycosyltransferase family 4 protein n=1 Tax=Flavobacterium columnare TaxID=996 RepID=A0A246GDW1_9FLAO|nr:glycosyltransferase [Flavobacterium oreochromis]OWP79599.1 hypothetical protein BWK62_01350 [Flavobacterium oreochromis]QYS86609.1 glycosyltransferase [Flavobacterium oreochromis]